MPNWMNCAISPRTRMPSCWSLSAESVSGAGFPGLKLGFNRVQGFFIEVSRKDAERVPADYVRRQTVKSPSASSPAN